MRARLKELVSKIDSMSATAEAYSKQAYEYERDENGNLLLYFKDGMEVKLPLVDFRPYQLELQKKLFVEKIKRIMLERPRRSGKEVESWSLLTQAAVTDPGLYIMVYPTNVRARKILWDGAAFINGRSVPFLEMIPQRLKTNINNSDMTIKLTNGAVIWVVGSDIDPDKLRGTNPLGIVYSEFAFQDPRVFYTMLPALRQNGGWLICQSTYDGMNHFYQMMQRNLLDPAWYCREDSIETLVDENGNRYITDEVIEEDRRAGMPEYLIQQEYYGKVQLNLETKYFAEGLNNIYESKRIIKDLYFHGQNLYAAYDIGVSDSTAITLFQIEIKNGSIWPSVISYVEANNKDLQYYVNEIRRIANRFRLNIHTHFLPHDGRKRDFGNNLKSIPDYLHEMGERAIVVPRPNSKLSSIELMRQTLYRTSFNETETERLIDCLSNYSKEFDVKMNDYKPTPKHDWTSHGVDSYQTMCIAIASGLIHTKPREIFYME